MIRYGIPGIRDYMADPDFWISRMDGADDIILDGEGIRKFNAILCSSIKNVYNLQDYKSSLTGEELYGFISYYKVPESIMYDIDGREIPKSFLEKAAFNTNMDGICDENPVRYGIAVKNISIRSFPVDEGVFKTADDREFDRFQETGCHALEPVAVLHESRDGAWYFVQCSNYRGWARKEGIALGKNKSQVFDYASLPDFLIVTGNRVHTQFNPYEPRVSSIEFYMGTRIPYEAADIPESIGNQSTAGNYCVRLAVRDDDGNLEFKTGLIASNEDVNEGCLGYTRANIIGQVFKLLGDRYGWGDSFDGTDCSGTILNVYKTVGLMLPRNAGEQERVPGIKYTFDRGSSTDDRSSLLSKAKPGAAIYMPGHVMMYLGCVEGEHFMIHNFHQFGTKHGDVYRAVPVNEVAVTSTLLPTVSGMPFINAFTSVLQFEFE